MPFCRSTPAGSLPPSCKYLWTASRPVKRVPEISTASRTLSERMSASWHGVFSSVISVEPTFDIVGGIELHALAPISPAHITYAHKERGGEAIRGANFCTQQRRLAAKTHRADA